MEPETWRACEGLEHHGIEASNLGRIRKCVSIDGAPITPRILPQRLNGNPYPIVQWGVRRPDHRKTGTMLKLVHILVARAFVPGYRPGLVVNHKDENTRNPYATNLEWVTQKENIRLSSKLAVGKGARKRKWPHESVEEMFAMRKRGATQSEICAKFPPLQQFYLSLILNGHRCTGNSPGRPRGPYKKRTKPPTAEEAPR